MILLSTSGVCSLARIRCGSSWESIAVTVTLIDALSASRVPGCKNSSGLELLNSGRGAAFADL